MKNNKNKNDHDPYKDFYSQFASSEDGDDDDDDEFDEFDEEFDKRRQKGKEKDEFAQLLEESLGRPQRKISPGDKLRCELVAVGGEEVFLSVETKGMPVDGSISRRELLNAEGNFEHKVGDFLDLYVTKVRGSKITLSTTPLARNQAEDIGEAYRTGLPMEGRVTEPCKGGVKVSLRGKMAFCPIGQLDLARVENVENYLGQKFEFVITQFSEGGRNIVVSRRRLLQSQKNLSEEAFTRERKEGEIVSGIVKKIEAFGAFVEIAPGIEGLVHISELSWSRVASPEEVVSVGQEVKVKILQVESKDDKGEKREGRGRMKISLSLKQATAEPWSAMPANIKEGHVVDGKVMRCMKFGAFVEIAPGIEGLVPLSEMSHTKRVVRSDEFIKEGDHIAVMIKEIHPETKRVLLSLRDAGVDPWVLVPQKYPVGAIVAGKVDRRETYGLFIELEEGVIGLLHKSKAVENPEFPYDKLKTGEMVTVQIGEVKNEERKLSLNVPKDPDQDEWKKHAKASKLDKGAGPKLAEKFKNIVIKS